VKKEKEPKDLLLECLKDIESDLINADQCLSTNINREEARRHISRTIGRIRNFKTVLGYLEGE
jgi:hypothetical protein